MDPRPESLGDWFDRQLLVTLTLVSTLDTDRVLAVLGATDVDRGELSLLEAYDLDVPTVRVGRLDGWTYAVEHQSTTAADGRVLERLTSDGSRAVTVCLTATLNSVHVAKAGSYLVGFEPGFPDSIRWGSTPHAFDRQIDAAGFRHEGYEPPGTALATFLHLVTGVTLSPAVLDGPLPCASLRTRGSRPRDIVSPGPVVHIPLIPGVLIAYEPRDDDTAAPG